jgi:hypothetical protein
MYKQGYPPGQPRRNDIQNTGIYLLLKWRVFYQPFAGQGAGDRA